MLISWCPTRGWFKKLLKLEWLWLLVAFDAKALCCLTLGLNLLFWLFRNLVPRKVFGVNCVVPGLCALTACTCKPGLQSNSSWTTSKSFSLCSIVRFLCPLGRLSCGIARPSVLSNFASTYDSSYKDAYFFNCCLNWTLLTVLLAVSSLCVLLLSRPASAFLKDNSLGSTYSCRSLSCSSSYSFSILMWYGSSCGRLSLSMSMSRLIFLYLRNAPEAPHIFLTRWLNGYWSGEPTLILCLSMISFNFFWYSCYNLL